MKTANWITMLLIGSALIALGITSAGQAGMLRGQRPADLGPRDGLLKRPEPGMRNVVSSLSQDHASTIAPLVFNGDPAAAFRSLQMILSGLPHATIIASQPDYLQVEFQTSLLKFVDDAEFLLDAKNGRIEMRSASRLGQYDFGANRARLERLRKAFEVRQAHVERPIV